MRAPARSLGRSVAPLLGVAALLASAGPAWGDCDAPTKLTTCIDADELWPHAGPGRFAAIGAAETTAARAVGFGLVTSYAFRPIKLHVPSSDPDGTDVNVVNHLVDATFLWSLGLSDRLELDAALPTTLYQSGAGITAYTSSQYEKLPHTAIRDPRFGLTWALAPRPRAYPSSGLALAARFELAAPVAQEDAFAGDRGFVGIPSLVADVRSGAFFGSVELGARLRETTDFATARLGSQGVVAVGGGVDVVGEKLGVAVEAFALPELVAQPNGAALVPAEWMASARTAFGGGDFSATLGAGTALPLSSGAVTASRFRGMLALRYAPLARDSDGDGVLDKDDRCPAEREDRDGFEDADGCPDPDNDKDGIPDARDRCRDEAETVDGFRDDDGCPDLDDDGDGIADEADKCRMEPEDRDGFQDDDGCPDPDNDGDGIPDATDRCPNAAEDRDGYQDQDGCPDPDDDLDGIPDDKDQCPHAAEDKDGFQDGDGCPDPDDDEDGVPDARDRCPRDAETIDGKDDADGCPEPGAHDVVHWRGNAIVLDHPARFPAASATLGPDLVRDVALIAQRAEGRAPLAQLIVETYADRPGDDDRNGALAAKRADALKAAFVAAGIPAERVVSAVGDLSAKRPAGAPPFDVHVVREKPAVESK